MKFIMPGLPTILFEGAADRAFLEALLKAIGLRDQFDFQKGDGGGKDSFERYLKGFITGTTQPTTIIIVADNDGDPAGAFQNVQSQITAAGYTLPCEPRQLVETVGKPRLVVLMIPWDADIGCLETLCFRAVNSKYQNQLDCADAFVTCVGADGWDIAKKAKLRMRGFLSAVCQGNPNTGLQFAWNTEKGRPGDIFPFHNEAFKSIADFIRTMAA